MRAVPGRVWRAATYFSLCGGAALGFLAGFECVCLSCGSLLGDGETLERAFFLRGRDGLCARSAVGRPGRAAVGN